MFFMKSYIKDSAPFCDSVTYIQLNCMCLSWKRKKLQQNQYLCLLKLKNIFNNAFWDTLKDIFGQNSCKKGFLGFSVIVWHGQFCCISQIQTKRVGAWPLWFFFIMKHIFEVSNFNCTNLQEKNVFFVDVTLSRSVQIWGVFPFCILYWIRNNAFVAKIATVADENLCGRDSYFFKSCHLRSSFWGP